MTETKTIRTAMLRLSSIAGMHYHYDPLGEIFGDGPIHFLLEVCNRFFVAWEDNDTGKMVVNPITRFDLHSLEEIGSAESWTVLRVPATMAEGICFRQMCIAELNGVYRGMTSEAALQ